MRGYLAALAALLAVPALGGCANETGAQSNFNDPSHLGANLVNMGGARSEQLAKARSQDQDLVIEPSSSSKVLSAIVFERVTGRTAYPGGSVLEK